MTLSSALPLSLLLFSILTAGPSNSPAANPDIAAVPEDSEFTKVSLAKKDTISGKNHAVAAYGIVLFVIVAYAFSIWWRARLGRRALRKLRDRIPRTT